MRSPPGEAIVEALISRLRESVRGTTMRRTASIDRDRQSRTGGSLASIVMMQTSCISRLIALGSTAVIVQAIIADTVSFGDMVRREPVKRNDGFPDFDAFTRSGNLCNP
jgi:hypothetical protein